MQTGGALQMGNATFLPERNRRSDTVFRRVVKRPLVTGALVCVLTLLGAAVPALSSIRSGSDPVDFSMKPPTDALLAKASRGERVVSRPLRAPSASTSWA